MTKPSLDGAKYLIARLIEAGHEAYLVGGCVRDLLRQVEPDDYDIATSARPEEVQRLFPRTIPVGASFGVVLVLEKGHPYEVASFRTDLAYLDGRRPSGIEYASAREDVLRRDFTVNGLLMNPLTGEILDYVGGREDIKAGIIRAIGKPEKRFAEDHLRLLRAVRLAAVLDYEIEEETFNALQKQAAKILLVAVERIREEMNKLLSHGNARKGFELLDASGILHHILPEVTALKGVLQPRDYHPEGDVWEHTLQMLALMSSSSSPAVDERLAWAVLLHDIGKPSTLSVDDRGIHFFGHTTRGVEIADQILRRLRFSTAARETVLGLIQHHMHFLEVRKLRPAKLKRFLRLPDFSLHLELHRLDCLASHGKLDNYHFCLEKLAHYEKEDLRPPPILTGDDLLDLGFKPGPLFKTILSGLEDAQLEGQVHNREEAILFVRDRFTASGR